MMEEMEKRIESQLARADGYLLGGNFALALKEFEKVRKTVDRDDLVEKIDRCRKEMAADNARQLIKKARRAEKKGDSNAALTYFQQANAVLNEAWISQRIEELMGLQSGRDALGLATGAEASRDFVAAAAHYAKASEASGDDRDRWRVQSARCLVKAGQYAEAVDIFKTGPPSGAGGRYDYGFALARIGRPAECLRVWETLDIPDERFLAEQRRVARRLGADLVKRIKANDDPGGVVTDARYLLERAGALLTPNERLAAEKIHEQATHAQICQAWAAKQFDVVGDILKHHAPCPTPAWVALHAKTGYQLAKADGRHLPAMLLYWVSAIHSPEIAKAFGDTAEAREKVRRKLFEAAEALIRENDDIAEVQRVLNGLRIDGELIETLLALMEKQGKHADLIFTPTLAAHLGRSEEILGLIRENEAFFSTRQAYLETGAYYSAAGRHFYHLRNQNDEAAAEILGDISKDLKSDEFVQYAIQVIHFEVGLARLQEEDSHAFSHFQSAPDLFDRFPELETKLTQQALAFDEWLSLKPFEDVLAFIYQRRATEAIRKTLSLVMARRATALFNTDSPLPHTTIKRIMDKALKLDPENEIARQALKDITGFIEIEEIDTAISRRKMGRASQIARDSRSENVRDSYFEAIEILFRELIELDWDLLDKQIAAQDLLKWAETVDETRPILDELRSFLNMNP